MPYISMFLGMLTTNMNAGQTSFWHFLCKEAKTLNTRVFGHGRQRKGRFHPRKQPDQLSTLLPHICPQPKSLNAEVSGAKT